MDDLKKSGDESAFLAYNEDTRSCIDGASPGMTNIISICPCALYGLFPEVQ